MSTEAPAPCVPAESDARRVAILIQLRAARHLLEKPGVWIHRGPEAMNGAGELCRPVDLDAVRFTLDGALRAVNGGSISPAYPVLNDICGKPAFEFNEHPKTTLASVLSLLDSAIERQERTHVAATVVG